MCENFKLPLCPKCKDTKYAHANQIQLLIPTSPQMHCDKCNISWWTSGFLGRHLRGTIRDDETGEYYHT